MLYEDNGYIRKAQEIRSIMTKLPERGYYNSILECQDLFKDKEDKLINLSAELANHLKEKYPNKFNVYEIELGKEELDILLEDSDKLTPDQIKIKETILAKNDVNIHDILIVEDKGDKYVFYKDTEDLYVHSSHNTATIVPPDEWYNFLEIHGILPGAAEMMYTWNNRFKKGFRFKHLRTRGTFDMLYYCWPLRNHYKGQGLNKLT